MGLGPKEKKVWSWRSRKNETDWALNGPKRRVEFLGPRIGRAIQDSPKQETWQWQQVIVLKYPIRDNSKAATKNKEAWSQKLAMRIQILNFNYSL